MPEEDSKFKMPPPPPAPSEPKASSGPPDHAFPLHGRNSFLQIGDNGIAFNNRSRAVQAAMRAYLSDPKISLRKVHEETPIDLDDDDSPLVRDYLGYDALLALSKTWREQREQLWEGVQERITHQIASKAVQRSINEIQVLQNLFDAAGMKTAQMLEDPNGPAFKSPETAISAAAKLGKVLAELRAQLSQDLVQGGLGSADLAEGGGGATPAIALRQQDAVALVDDAFSDEEIAQLGIALTRQIDTGAVKANDFEAAAVEPDEVPQSSTPPEDDFYYEE